jgi:ATP adenylyltransferase
MEYISGESAKRLPEGACVFCHKWEETDDAENLVLCRGETCYLLMNLFPYTNGHLMVAPARHTSDFHSLSEAEQLEMFSLTQKGLAALRRAMNPDGFNLGMNLGRTAGAGIEEHLHLHIVPRWNGDTNFMSVLGETRVISEAIQESYEKLAEALSG